LAAHQKSPAGGDRTATAATEESSMQYAAITGWGKCMPPAVLSNADLATIMDTDDEWITTRTGIRERRVSHVSGVELSRVASARALACAGIGASDIDLIVYGSCSNDEQIPNSASGLQYLLGANHAAAMDINTACTSFLYSLSTANAMIRTGAIRSALVVGVEVIAPFMDWTNRNVAVLFGDGAAAVVLQASDRPEGVLGEKLGCYADARQTLRVRGTGLAYANGLVTYGDTMWDFDGQEIFKRAVVGMSHASADVLARCGYRIDDVGLVVPHQANQRIIDFVARKVGAPMDKVYLTIQRYGNMSAATVPVALVDALEEGRVAPGSLVLTPAFGGGLTWCAHLIRWGERTTPLDTTDIDLPPQTQSALEMVRVFMANKGVVGRSTAGLNAVRFPESA
jgi:3-oxoacyl-[acyl-carrier-protein] synthase-3